MIRIFILTLLILLKLDFISRERKKIEVNSEVQSKKANNAMNVFR